MDVCIQTFLINFLANLHIIHIWLTNVISVFSHVYALKNI